MSFYPSCTCLSSSWTFFWKQWTSTLFCLFSIIIYHHKLKVIVYNVTWLTSGVQQRGEWPGLLGLFDIRFSKNWDFSKKAKIGQNKGLLTHFKVFGVISPIHWWFQASKSSFFSKTSKKILKNVPIFKKLCAYDAKILGFFTIFSAQKLGFFSKSHSPLRQVTPPLLHPWYEYRLRYQTRRFLQNKMLIF